MPPNAWGVNGGVRDSDNKWNDNIPVLIFDNPVDGKKWECQHYEDLGLTAIQTWLLHFWHTTKDKPCLLLQPSVFDGRTHATNYLPNRDLMMKTFKTTWCGQEHTDKAWMNWTDKRQLTYQTTRAFKQFRSKSRRNRASYPFPKSRPYQVGRRIVLIQKCKDQRTKKANQRQRAKDATIRQYRGWNLDQALKKSVQAAIRCGGFAKFDDARKIMAFCDQAPVGAKRRHRAKFRPKGGQAYQTRAKIPTGRTVSQLLRDFQTEHEPKRMDLKNDDGTHFESGARFDTVVEVNQIIKDLANRDKMQEKSQSRVWTGHIGIVIVLRICVGWPFFLFFLFFSLLLVYSWQ
jgi:hypothetical protein